MATAGEYYITVAIDIGTTYSGFAHRLRTKDDIDVKSDWAERMQLAYKAPTCVLFDDADGSVTFGYKARDDYIKKAEKRPTDSNLRFFDHFKMELYDLKSTKEGRSNATALDQLQLESKNGQQMKAIDVFTAALKELEDLCLKDCDKKYGFKRKSTSDILWVVTVPAIWRDEAKHFMRLASFKAGLISSINSRHLVIALEPEAAGLLCRTLPIARYDRADRVDDKLQAGDAYLVIDVGGGTVDIASLQEISEFAIRHVHFSHGAAHGGRAVDEAFVKLIDDIFDISEFRSSCPADFEELMERFEEAKWNFDEKEKGLRINLTVEFMAFRNKNVLHKMVGNYNQRHSSNVQLSRGKLVLPPNFSLDLYKPVVSDIIDCIRGLYDDVVKHTKIQFFYLVGGFAKTNYLLDEIKSAFPAVTVVRPDEPGFAVLKGAVLYGESMSGSDVCEKDEKGKHLSIVQERKMSRSYGVAIREPFNEKKHGKLEDLERDGLINIKTVNGKQKKYRINVFDEYVRKGTSIKVDHSATHTLKTRDRNPDSLTIEIYSHESAEDRVKYITDKDSDGKPLCQFLGSVTLKRTSKAEDYADHEVRLKFGGTEIQAFVKDTTTGLYTEKAIDYFV